LPSRSRNYLLFYYQALVQVEGGESEGRPEQVAVVVLVQEDEEDPVVEVAAVRLIRDEVVVLTLLLLILRFLSRVPEKLLVALLVEHERIENLVQKIGF